MTDFAGIPNRVYTDAEVAALATFNLQGIFDPTDRNKVFSYQHPGGDMTVLVNVAALLGVFTPPVVVVPDDVPASDLTPAQVAAQAEVDQAARDKAAADAETADAADARATANTAAERAAADRATADAETAQADADDAVADAAEAKANADEAAADAAGTKAAADRAFAFESPVPVAEPVAFDQPVDRVVAFEQPVPVLEPSPFTPTDARDLGQAAADAEAVQADADTIPLPSR